MHLSYSHYNLGFVMCILMEDSQLKQVSKIDKKIRRDCFDSVIGQIPVEREKIRHLLTELMSKTV